MAHDPATAWAIVVGYFIAAALAVLAARSAGHERRDRAFWLIAAAILLLLGLNKQLDLQTMLTTIGRDIALRDGWFEQRRVVQGLFLAGLGLAALIAAAIGWRLLRGAPAAVWAGAIGLGLLTLFVLARAATFHHIDIWTTVEVAGLRRGRWLEIAGILVVAAAAMTFLRGRTGVTRLTSGADSA